MLDFVLHTIRSMRIACVRGIVSDLDLLTFFDSIIVVVVDKVFDGSDEFSPASVDVVCLDFSIQDAKEVFHGCVVVAVAFSRHALKDVVFF